MLGVMVTSCHLIESIKEASAKNKQKTNPNLTCLSNRKQTYYTKHEFVNHEKAIY